MRRGRAEFSGSFKQLLRFFGVVWPLDFYQSAKFYVAFYPGASGWWSPRIKPALEKRNIDYLDYSDLNLQILTRNRGFLPGDGHPAPIAHYAFARLIDRDLK